MLPWEDLPEALKVSNFHQVAYAENILKTAGLGIRPITDPGKPLVSMTELLGEAGLERLAEMEHGRWNVERLLLGWRWAEAKDVGRKLSPYLVPWDKLSPEIQEYDLDAIRSLPAEVPRGRAWRCTVLRSLPAVEGDESTDASGTMSMRTLAARGVPGDHRAAPCAVVGPGRRAGRRGRRRRRADRRRDPARRDLLRAGHGGTGRRAALRSRPARSGTGRGTVGEQSEPCRRTRPSGSAMRIKAVKSDLQDQIDGGAGDPGGRVSPDCAFLTSPLFADSGPTATYRLIDDPAVKATADAAADLAAQCERAGKEVRRNCRWWSPRFRRRNGPARCLQRQSATGTACRPAPWSTRRASVPRIAAVSGARRMPTSTMRSLPREMRRRSSRRFPGRPHHRRGRREVAQGVRAEVAGGRDSPSRRHRGRLRVTGRKGRSSSAGQAAAGSRSRPVGFGRDRRDRLAWILWANAALLAALTPPMR